MFIAEIGINHNGDIGTALKLIDMAKRTGADVVKFQKRTPEMCVPGDQKDMMKDTPWGRMTYLEYKKRIEFGKEEYDAIDKYCKEKEIKWTASVWDIPSLEFLLQYDVPFIKIPSACITNIELLEMVRRSGKPIIMSTGMSTEQEVDMAVTSLGKADITILHCNSSYPSRYDELDLNNITHMKSKYPHAKIGYSGHEEGILPTMIAAVLGAEVIERHITLDKNMWGTDQKCSLDYDELVNLFLQLTKVDLIMGNYGIRCYPSEEEVKKKLRI